MPLQLMDAHLPEGATEYHLDDRVPEDPAVDEGRRGHDRQQGYTIQARQQALEGPSRLRFGIYDALHEHFVEKTLHERRHSFPPDGENKYDMIRGHEPLLIVGHERVASALLSPIGQIRGGHDGIEAVRVQID